MAKLDRQTQEIFCSQGGSQQITAFGTAKNDTPTYTSDIAQIQNNNFLYGWTSALLPDKAPFKEDSNGLFYLLTRQLAYLFQEGIPEYDPNTNYSQNAFARGISSADIYVSLIPDNKGNPLSYPYWKLLFEVDNDNGEITPTAQYEIGTPQMTLSNTLLSNEIWLEGATVSRTQYANLFKIYGTTYGAGNGTTTFKLPDFRNRAIWGANTFGYLNAGLPNISGSASALISLYNKQPSVLSGCFTSGDKILHGLQGHTVFAVKALNFNASLSNPIYGASNTVQPPAIKVRVKTRYQ